jgi:hypothetical protein
MIRPQSALLTILWLSWTQPGIAADAYGAKLLHPDGFEYSNIVSLSKNYQAGYGRPSTAGLPEHAIVWSGSAASAVDLSPSSMFESHAEATTDTYQFGYGRSNSQPSNPYHALMWFGTAESMVDMNPPGFISSRGIAASGDIQVGSGSLTEDANQTHALVWRGTAASAVDINPPGFDITRAFAISGNMIGGWGRGPATGGVEHPLLWDATTGSYTDLYPSTGPYFNILISGVSADRQIGGGTVANPFDPQRHALLWNGTAESAVILNPPGYSSCEGLGLAGNNQVGYCRGNSPDLISQAWLWHGSADTAIDLNAIATPLFPNSWGAVALDVDAAGNIVGHVRDGNTRPHAVMWIPVPEPASRALFACVLVVVSLLQGRRRR